MKCEGNNQLMQIRVTLVTLECQEECSVIGCDVIGAEIELGIPLSACSNPSEK